MPRKLEGQPSALFRHSIKVYAELMERATEEEVQGQKLMVYRGSVSVLFNELKIPSTYYTRIFRSLEASGNITQLQRGARGFPTTYVLHGPPERSVWEETSAPPLTQVTPLDKLTQRVENLERAIGGLNIVEALSSIDKRLNDMATGKGR